MTALCCDHDLPRATQRERQSGEDAEVGVKLNARDAAHAHRRKSVFVLQVSERALHGSAAKVKVTPTLSVTRDARLQSPAERERKRRL